MLKQNSGWMKTGLFLFAIGAILTALLFVMDQEGSVCGYLLFGVLYYYVAIGSILEASIGLRVLCILIVLGCFLPAYLLCRYLPGNGKHFAKLWPIICFFVWMAYVDGWQYWILAFYPGFGLALAGLLVGKLVCFICEKQIMIRRNVANWETISSQERTSDGSET